MLRLLLRTCCKQTGLHLHVSTWQQHALPNADRNLMACYNKYSVHMQLKLCKMPASSSPCNAHACELLSQGLSQTPNKLAQAWLPGYMRTNHWRLHRCTHGNGRMRPPLHRAMRGLHTKGTRVCHAAHVHIVVTPHVYTQSDPNRLLGAADGLCSLPTLLQKGKIWMVCVVQGQQQQQQQQGSFSPRATSPAAGLLHKLGCELHRDMHQCTWVQQPITP